MIHPKKVIEIVDKSFGIEFQKPKELLIPYEDLLKFVEFVINSTMESSIRETERLLNQQQKDFQKIHYN